MRRLVPLLVLLAACRAVEPTGPGALPPEPAPSAPAVTAGPTTPAERAPRSEAEQHLWERLGEDVSDGNRAVIARYRVARMTPDGEAFIDGGDAQAFDDAEVIDVQGDRLRVIDHGSSRLARIALWIDEADTAPQLSRPATLLPEPRSTGKPEDGTIELAPGERIEVLERTETHVKVSTRDGAFTGWVEQSKLSAVFVDSPFELPRFDGETKPNTPVARTPGGAPFFTLGPLDNGTHLVRVTSSPRPGARVGSRPGPRPGPREEWLAIEYVEFCRRGVRVRGWVPAASTELVGEQLMGFGCAGGHGSRRMSWGELDRSERMTVPRDTELRTVDGVLFGRTRGDVELRRGSDGTWRVLTSWGAVPVVATR